MQIAIIGHGAIAAHATSVALIADPDAAGNFHDIHPEVRALPSVLQRHKDFWQVAYQIRSTASAMP